MIVKINSIELEGVESFAQTKQANDIASISNRQSNFATMRVPKTATNAKVFSIINGLGSQSNFPYQRQTAEVIDPDTGEHLVKDGFAILREVGDAYVVAIYDGLLNFIKQIENTTLFEVGLPALNHVKNVQTVIDSWNDPDGFYRYLVADYNGRNIIAWDLNIDFQVPSARVSYLWERIFDFAGWTFSGSIFSREAFTELYLTYPKPAPTDEPVVIPLVDEDSQLITTVSEFPTESGVFFGSTTIAQLITQPLQVTQTGAHRIQISGAFFTNSLGQGSTFVRVIVTDFIEPTFDEVVNFAGLGEIVVQASAGQFITLQLTDEQGFPFNGISNPQLNIQLFGSVNTKIDFIDGFVLGFDEAFIDFKCTDFLREIMVRFGLTPITDNFNKHIEFLTLTEKLQSPKRLDWSAKFVSASKSFVFQNYAQRNDFRFRYNEENEKHENAHLSVNNQNLNEEFVAFQSATYAPERNTLPLLGFNTRTFRIWNKELTDEGEIEYKDLDGRFYFVRAEQSNLSIDVVSEILSQAGTNVGYFKASYFRCSWRELLIDFYTNFRQIVSRSTLYNVQANLTKLDIKNIRFDELVFFKQLGQYGFINKVGAYRKNQPTALEVVGVDFFTEPSIIEPPLDFITINSVNESGCEVIIDFDTSLPLPMTANVTVFRGQFTFSGFEYLEAPELNQENAGISPFLLDANTFPNGFYKFQLTNVTGFNVTTSNISEAIELNCFAEQDSVFIRVLDVKPSGSNISGILKNFDYNITITMGLATPPLNFVVQFFQNGIWFNQPVTFTGTPTNNGDGTQTVEFQITYNTFSATPPTTIIVIFGSVQSTPFDL